MTTKLDRKKLWGLLLLVLAGGGLFFYREVMVWPTAANTGTLGGKVVNRIADGDYVHPSLSPDGRWLAYSSSVTENGKQISEVLLKDLEKGTVKTMLSARETKELAVYAAVVLEIEWLDQENFQVTVFDGDVGYTIIIFSVQDPKVEYRYKEMGDKDELPPEKKKVLENATAVFPDLDRKMLASAVEDASNVIVPGSGMLMQKNYHGYDDDIWFVDFRERDLKRLVKLPEEAGYALGGGFSLGEDVVFLVARVTSEESTCTGGGR